MEINKNYVELEVSDGTSMAGYTAAPAHAAGKLPGIIVLQEAFGVNHHMRDVSGRFAEKGYIAISPELFHCTAPKGFEGSYSDFGTVIPHYSALANQGLEADLSACYQWLSEQENIDGERIFAIGYCLGGRVSLLANAVPPPRAAVSYYGGGSETIADRAAELHGKHLFFWAGLDKHIKSENTHLLLNALEAAGKDFINVKISYADHAFNCNDRPNYHPVAAKDAWALTLSFLANS